MALTLPNDMWWLIYHHIEDEKKMEVKKYYNKYVVDLIDVVKEDVDMLESSREELPEEYFNNYYNKSGSFVDWYFDYYFCDYQDNLKEVIAGHYGREYCDSLYPQ